MRVRTESAAPARVEEGEHVKKQEELVLSKKDQPQRKAGQTSLSKRDKKGVSDIAELKSHCGTEKIEAQSTYFEDTFAEYKHYKKEAPIGPRAGETSPLEQGIRADDYLAELQSRLMHLRSRQPVGHQSSTDLDDEWKAVIALRNETFKDGNSISSQTPLEINDSIHRLRAGETLPEIISPNPEEQFRPFLKKED